MKWFDVVENFVSILSDKVEMLHVTCFLLRVTLFMILVWHIPKSTSRIIEVKSGTKLEWDQQQNCMPAWCWPHFGLVLDLISIIRYVPFGIWYKNLEINQLSSFYHVFLNLLSCLFFDHTLYVVQRIKHEACHIPQKILHKISRMQHFASQNFFIGKKIKVTIDLKKFSFEFQ